MSEPKDLEECNKLVEGDLREGYVAASGKAYAKQLNAAGRDFTKSCNDCKIPRQEFYGGLDLQGNWYCRECASKYFLPYQLDENNEPNKT